MCWTGSPADHHEEGGFVPAAVGSHWGILSVTPKKKCAGVKAEVRMAAGRAPWRLSLCSRFRSVSDWDRTDGSR